MTTFNELMGLTLSAVEGLQEGSEEVRFTTTDGRVFRMHHWQDCCETVSIVDVTGDPDDLLGEAILRAEESSADAGDNTSESGTWTFYKLATRKGYVDIRWLGESNGYYSESVDFEEVK